MPDVLVDDAEELVEIGRWPSLDRAYEYALVVLAMKRDCFVSEDGGSFVLAVEPEIEQRAREELADYAHEQTEWRQRPEPVGQSVGMEVAAFWVLALVVVFLLRVRDPSLIERYCNSSIALVQSHEWWRPFTALFFHADFPHLAGNVLIGGVFCLLVAQSFGQVRGWALVLGSGVLGNIATASFRWPEAFRSIGASTATFGALGVLVGMGLVVAWRSRSYSALKPCIVPFAVGLVLFGWFGVGGVDTDVLGHVFGAVSGFALGAIATLFLKPEPRGVS